MSSQTRNSVHILAPYFSRTRGVIKPGVFRMQQLLANQSDLFPSYESLLVAGTNGKGSVCSLLESMLRHCGIKTGLYTSPHLVHPNERIRVNGIPVSEQHLTAAVESIEHLSKTNLPNATFFEILTAIALQVFSKEQCEVVVFEVGLGGRLDSTNVIAPLVSVVTTVAMDHIDYLGNTLTSIATEKAHVARRNRPLVVGGLEAEAMQAVKTVSDSIGAQLILASHQNLKKFSSLTSHPKLTQNNWLSENLSHFVTALNALEQFETESQRQFLLDDVLKGALATFWPGRFDVRKKNQKTYIFDAGHNPAGLAYFARQLKQSRLLEGKNTVLIFGCLNDKDASGMLPCLATLGVPIFLTEPTSERAQSAESLALVAQPSCGSLARVKKNLRQALTEATNQAEVVVVTGSIALIGEAMEELGFEPFAPQEG